MATLTGHQPAMHAPLSNKPLSEGDVESGIPNVKSSLSAHSMQLSESQEERTGWVVKYVSKAFGSVSNALCSRLLKTEEDTMPVAVVNSKLLKKVLAELDKPPHTYTQDEMEALDILKRNEYNAQSLDGVQLGVIQSLVRKMHTTDTPVQNAEQLNPQETFLEETHCQLHGKIASIDMKNVKKPEIWELLSLKDSSNTANNSKSSVAVIDKLVLAMGNAAAKGTDIDAELELLSPAEKKIALNYLRHIEDQRTSYLIGFLHKEQNRMAEALEDYNIDSAYKEVYSDMMDAVKELLRCAILDEKDSTRATYTTISLSEKFKKALEKLGAPTGDPHDPKTNLLKRMLLHMIEMEGMGGFAKFFAIAISFPLIVGTLLTQSGFTAPQILGLLGRNMTGVMKPDGQYHFKAGAPSVDSAISSYSFTGLVGAIVAFESTFVTSILRFAKSRDVGFNTQAAIVTLGIALKAVFAFETAAYTDINGDMLQPLAYEFGASMVLSEFFGAYAKIKFFEKYVNESSSELKKYILSNVTVAVIHGLISASFCLSRASSSNLALPILVGFGGMRFSLPYSKGLLKKLFSYCSSNQLDNNENYLTHYQKHKPQIMEARAETERLKKTKEHTILCRQLKQFSNEREETRLVELADGVMADRIRHCTAGGRYS